MDTPIMDRIEEGITKAATGKFNDYGNENETREHALKKTERDFERDLSPNQKGIVDDKTIKNENKEKAESNLNEQ
ncbi:unnamed protein product, partial [Mesorhabditis belari]|uniref:Uncharacterized protein n=1 Tax=Mesorhabditis belari TaxID=2138241 RepID=A0AAF3F857_9BILA